MWGLISPYTGAFCCQCKLFLHTPPSPVMTSPPYGSPGLYLESTGHQEVGGHLSGILPDTWGGSITAIEEKEQRFSEPKD